MFGAGPVLTVAELARAAGGRVVRGDPSTGVTRVSADSRTCGPGALFVALRGRNRDGHEFVADAARRGAAAALVERVVEAPLAQVQVPDTLRALLPVAAAWRRRLSVRVVGVTGSVGKSTTVQMVAAVLRTRYPTAASQPEWNAELGVPLTVFRLDPGHRYAVLELAMRGLGQIASLCAVVRPAVGVVTRVGAVHTEQLGSVENVARAKAELVQALPPGGLTVLNGDDPRVRAMATETVARVVYYGTGPHCHVRAERVEPDPEGVGFHLRTPAGSSQAFLPVPSPHLVHNALAAVATGLAEGVPLEEAVAALREFRPPAMRLEILHLRDGVVLVNDAYNASPLSVEAALEVVRVLRRGRRLVAVLGEMRELGEFHRAAHEEVGCWCARDGVDLLVAVGEGARELAEAARREGLPETCVYWLPDAESAAGKVAALVRPGDVVLVKGSRAVGLERVAQVVAGR